MTTEYDRKMLDAMWEASLGGYLGRQMKWSRRTFGPGKRIGGITKHIEKELVEVRAKPEDLGEWVDVIILALDGYWRNGGTPASIMEDLVNRQERNFARTYPMPKSQDEVSEHVKGTP